MLQLTAALFGFFALEFKSSSFPTETARVGEAAVVGGLH
jgi:hypothetical protein